jgi:hypothetical protein
MPTGKKENERKIARKRMQINNGRKPKKKRGKFSGKRLPTQRQFCNTDHASHPSTSQWEGTGI